MPSDLDDYAEASQQLTLPDAAILAIRVFSLYLAYYFASTVIQFVASLPWVIHSATWRLSDMNTAVAAMDLLLLCIWGVAAVVFWVLAPRLSHWMLPHRSNAGGLSFSGQYLQAVALSVVGALLAAWSIPPLVQTLVLAYQSSGPQSNAGKVEIIAQAAALAVGIVLFLGAKGLAHHWHRIRGQGNQAKKEVS